MMLEEFAIEARRYVHWANGKSDEEMSVAMALRRIVALYAAALRLPGPFSGDLPHDENDRVDSGECKLIYERASTLPFKNYAEIFDPMTVPQPEESVIGDIADDIADIYRDVASGLRLYDAGKAAAARWEWSFGLQNHWGKHATGAIRALHCYLAEEQVDGLTSGA